jgi:hypothetical protein
LVAIASGGPTNSSLTREHLRSDERPALMISPPPSYFEVMRRISLSHESAPSYQRNRGEVGGLDVGLQTMKFELAEGVPHYRDQAVPHDPLSLEPGKYVVLEITAPRWHPGISPEALDHLGGIDSLVGLINLIFTTPTRAHSPCGGVQYFFPAAAAVPSRHARLVQVLLHHLRFLLTESRTRST